MKKMSLLPKTEFGATLGGIAGLIIFGSAGLYLDLHSSGTERLSADFHHGWILTSIMAFLGIAFGGAGGALLGISSAEPELLPSDRVFSNSPASKKLSISNA